MDRTASRWDLRERALRECLGSMRLEGFDPSAELVSDLENWVAGEFPLAQVQKRMFDRFAHQDAALLAVAE